MRTKKRDYQYIRSQLLYGSYYNDPVSKKRHGVIRHYISGNNNIRRIRFIHEVCTDNEGYCRHFCGSKCGVSYAIHRAGLHNYSTHKHCTQK